MHVCINIQVHTSLSVIVVVFFQLIYDFKDGGGTFTLMSLHPDEILAEDVERFEKIGVEIPSMMYVHSLFCMLTQTHMYMIKSMNHNSLGCEQLRIRISHRLRCQVTQ